MCFKRGSMSKNKIDDMFGEINYCHECKFFVGGYCNGEKRNPKDYACLKFIKKKIMKQLFMCKFFSMHKLKDYDNYTISDIQGREIEKVIVKECEFCGELKIKRFSLLPIKDRSY